MRDDRPWGFAGLWDCNTRSGDPLETCAIITTDANELVGAFHDRMPVILAKDDFDAWLDPEFKDYNWLESRLQPWPAEEMEAWPVSPQVNRPAFNQADCIARIDQEGA
jgi:putative SOS response-associated peptidase YedK